MYERYIELQFYYFIYKLLYVFKHNIHILHIIESYCNLGDIDVVVIKKLLKQIRESQGLICSYQEETVAVLRNQGLSLRDIAKMSCMSLATVQRVEKRIKERPELYVEISGRLDKYEYEQVYKFMKIVNKIKEI